MKITILIASILSLNIIFTSCQKELSYDPPPASNTGTDSLYLDTAIFVGNEVSFNYDSTIKVYNYDNYKRIISISEKDLYNNSLSDSVFIQYYYNGMDSLPFKYTYNYNIFSDSSIGFATGIISYDNFGKKIQDSLLDAYKTHIGGNIISYNEKTIKKFNYTNNQILVSTNFTGIMPQPYNMAYIDTLWVDANNNISAENKYDISYSPTQPHLLIRANFTYDGHPTPESYLNIYSTLFDVLDEKAFPDNTWKTNFLTFDKYEPNYANYDNSYKFVNTYNSKGQLIKSNGNNSSSTTLLTHYFKYKAL